MRYLEGLNAAQKEAVLHTEGPLLVIAGAGAGKTRVIAHRILHIVAQGTAPENILAITVTNKAAREMRERVEALLRDTPEIARPAFETLRADFKPGLSKVGPQGSPFVATFHALGLAIIKENYRLCGFKRFPVIYDRADSLRTIKTALKEIGAEQEIEPRAALSTISRQKGEGLTAEQWEPDPANPKGKTIAIIWRKYDQALAQDQALDFDDILARAVRFLEQQANARIHYQNRWPYIHIDEYQDTNGIQARLVMLLLGAKKNICAVGDIDQTIYTWRGADIGNMLAFEKRYPGARAIVLEENYRSTKTILAAANDIIAKNAMRIEKTLFTAHGDGAPISFYQAWNEQDEAGFMARKIEELMDEGAEPRDFAALYRANFQSRALEEALLTANIPYQVLGTRFFERAEVKDCLALIRAAVYGSAADLARAAGNRPGIGKTTVLAIVSEREGELRGAAREKVVAFRVLLANIRESAAKMPPSQLITFVTKESGQEQKLRADILEGAERLQNLRELGALASRYDGMPAGEGLQTFLENVALASDQDEYKEEQNAVRLMTVHASKGLEFANVFITGMVEGLFPYSREDGSAHDKEEERRLMYVALTRAKKKVFLSMASVRTVFGSQSFSEPSQFIGDISPELIEMEAPERLGKTIYLD